MTDQTFFPPDTRPQDDGAPAPLQSAQPASKRIVIQSVTLMLLMVLLCGAMGIYVVSDRNVRAAYSLASTAAELQYAYSGKIDWSDVFQRGVDGMTSILDRYSYYMNTDQFGRLDEEFEGEYVGIGVSVVRDAAGLLVMSVRENGPAAKAGMLTGDMIIKIGDTVLRGYDPEKSIKMLRGKEGSSAHITVFRPVTHDTMEIAVERRKLELVHVVFAGYTPDTMVYLRVLDFENNTSDDIEAALDSLVINGPHKPHGIILDLRGNPGGLFQEAYQTANLFLNSGQFIVGTESRSRWNIEEIRADGADITGGLPMAILVDRGTASAAEIVSGALQKNKRAVLVGDTTFGKGLVQGFTRFSEGDGMRLTISRYYLEGKTYLNQVDTIVHDSGTGLPPDYVIPFIERKPFALALERSFLLQKFAHVHEAEILASDSILIIEHNLAGQFKKFAHDSGFVFKSDPAVAAGVVAEISRIDQAGPEVVSAAAQLLQIAQRLDTAQFSQYSDWIESRLLQLAVEHRYGVSQRYARVEVKYRSDIRYAAALLKARR
jgi:carboxyl-terminal processing protease